MEGQRGRKNTVFIDTDCCFQPGIPKLVHDKDGATLREVGADNFNVYEVRLYDTIDDRFQGVQRADVRVCVIQKDCIAHAVLVHTRRVLCTLAAARKDRHLVSDANARRQNDLDFMVHSGGVCSARLDLSCGNEIAAGAEADELVRVRVLQPKILADNADGAAGRKNIARRIRRGVCRCKRDTGTGALERNSVRRGGIGRSSEPKQHVKWHLILRHHNFVSNATGLQHNGYDCAVHADMQARVVVNVRRQRQLVGFNIGLRAKPGVHHFPVLVVETHAHRERNVATLLFAKENRRKDECRKGKKR